MEDEVSSDVEISSKIRWKSAERRDGREKMLVVCLFFIGGGMMC
jgi:hypothetical protein